MTFEDKLEIGLGVILGVCMLVLGVAVLGS